MWYVSIRIYFVTEFNFKLTNSSLSSCFLISKFEMGNMFSKNFDIGIKGANLVNIPASVKLLIVKKPKVVYRLVFWAVIPSLLSL